MYFNILCKFLWYTFVCRASPRTICAARWSLEDLGTCGKLLENIFQWSWKMLLEEWECARIVKLVRWITYRILSFIVSVYMYASCVHLSTQCIFKNGAIISNSLLSQVCIITNVTSDQRNSRGYISSMYTGVHWNVSQESGRTSKGQATFIKARISLMWIRCLNLFYTSSDNNRLWE